MIDAVNRDIHLRDVAKSGEQTKLANPAAQQTILACPSGQATGRSSAIWVSPA
jgi:hypothetical protein